MSMTTTQPAQGAPGEREAVASVRLDDAWALVEEFSTLVRDSGTGKIVVCEGQPMGGKTGDLQRRGAVGVVFVSPGERIHEGIVTTIWGSPDTTSWDRKARIPVISIGRSDGEKLIERIQRGPVE